MYCCLLISMVKKTCKLISLCEGNANEGRADLNLLKRRHHKNVQTISCFLQKKQMIIYHLL